MPVTATEGVTEMRGKPLTIVDGRGKPPESQKSKPRSWWLTIAVPDGLNLEYSASFGNL